MPFIILISCETEKKLNFRLPDDYKPAIVIHGIINPKTGVKVAVSKTAPIYESKNDTYPEDAVITLIEDNTEIFNLTETDSGVFVSPPGFIPCESCGYQIKASAPGLPSVLSSVQYIMPVVNIDSLRIVNNNGWYLEFLISDPAETNNYYYFKYDEAQITLDTTELFSNSSFITITADDSFNGEKKWHSIRYYSDPFTDTVIVNGYLFNISEDLNKFNSSMDEYYYTYGDPFLWNTSAVYSNIEGGYGIFASYSYSSKSIIFIQSSNYTKHNDK